MIEGSDILAAAGRIPNTRGIGLEDAGVELDARGYMKMLIDAKSDRILGFTMLGVAAGEVLAVVQTAMLGGLPFTGLRDAIFTHPTMSEGLNVLLSSVPSIQG